MSLPCTLHSASQMHISRYWRVLEEAIRFQCFFWTLKNIFSQLVLTTLLPVKHALAWFLLAILYAALNKLSACLWAWATTILHLELGMLQLMQYVGISYTTTFACCLLPPQSLTLVPGLLIWGLTQSKTVDQTVPSWWDGEGLLLYSVS